MSYWFQTAAQKKSFFCQRLQDYQDYDFAEPTRSEIKGYLDDTVKQTF